MLLSQVIPFRGWTQFTPTLPEFYWNVYSSEQRIKHICYELCKLYAYSDYLADSLNALGNDVENELTDIRNELDKKLAEVRAEIMEFLKDLVLGQLQWDVQIGAYNTSVQAQRDMFNDVTVHAITVDELATLNMTVDELANCGLNCRGLAVISYYLKSKFPLAPEYQYIDNDPTIRRLSVDDIIEAKVNSDGFFYV